MDEKQIATNIHDMLLGIPRVRRVVLKNTLVMKWMGVVE
jgi:hypothetical protein